MTTVEGFFGPKRTPTCYSPLKLDISKFYIWLQNDMRSDQIIRADRDIFIFVPCHFFIIFFLLLLTSPRLSFLKYTSKSYTNITYCISKKLQTLI